MSKAEKFIQDYTKNCSNELSWGDVDELDKEYAPWLTPDQAKTAVEIAREETIEQACDVIRHKYGHYNHLKGDIIEELIREFRKAMKNEKEGFYSFMAGIKELAKAKKPDERIVVDIYNSYGYKLNSDDEI